MYYIEPIFLSMNLIIDLETHHVVCFIVSDYIYDNNYHRYTTY